MISRTDPFPYLWACSALGILYAVVKLLRFGHREKHLPPGPPTWPIIGNAHLTVDPKIFKKFKQWSAQYGDVFSLKIGKGTMVVLNSKRAVYELVDQRSALYSSRPIDRRFRHAMRENFAFMDPTPIWRMQRKIAVRYLAPEKLDGELDKVSNAEITTLLHDLLVSPEDFIKHIERSTASFTAIVLYGQRAKSNDDFWARGVYEAMEAIMRAISPGSYVPAEQFPIFKLIPQRWDPSYARAQEGFDIPTRIWTESQRRVELRRSQGDKRDSLIDDLLSAEKELDPAFQGTMLANYLGAVMQAAAETSALSTKTNIMFLATHPEVQDKAQREIDAVCGVERLPCFSDFKAMPYINCIVKESQRIRPVVPTGIPHRCTQDNWYNGMLIPKDATIIIPHWALHHSKYEDAGTYNPDRYLNHPHLAWDYAGTKDFENRDHYNYGAGRRICAGIQLAERTQWRQVARILWAFRIERAVDEKTGEKIEIDLDAYEDKMVCGPEPFKVKFTPRSQRHVDLIKKEVGDVREILRAWE